MIRPEGAVNHTGIGTVAISAPAAPLAQRLARPASAFQQRPSRRAGLIRDPIRRQHARDLVHPLGLGQCRHGRTRDFAGDPLLDTAEAPTLAPGFPSRAYLIERYANRTGCDLTNLPFYVAFNRFKTACILHGVYARYCMGQKAIEAEDLELFRGRTMNAITRAEMALAELKG